MHEVSIMQNMLDLAVTQARQANAQKIHLIKLRIGALSGVMPEAIEFAFACATRDALTTTAKLEIERVAPLCYCNNCRIEFKPQGLLYECPRCHQFSAEARRGKELELVALEIS